MFQVSLAQLDTGMQLMTVPMPAVNSITALLLVNVGSRYEGPKEHGAAHLLEHLVFRGTINYPDGLQLSIALDSIGANSNAFTAKEYTGFYVTVASAHLETGLEILKELVFFPLIRATDVAQEKAVVIEEIKMHRDSPEDYVSDEFEQLVYHGTGLQHPISGSVSLVRQQSAASLRRFLHKWYGLENVTLVLAGDESKLTDQETLKQVRTTFSGEVGKKSREATVFDELTKRANHHQQRREQFLTSNPISRRKKVQRRRDTEQVHAVLGWPALRRDDPQRYVLTVLANIMGGNRSSRLFQTIREQANLAYYIYADIDQYHDGGVLGVSAGLNSNKYQRGLKLIQQEFAQVAEEKKPFTNEELARAQDYLTGRIVLGLESSRAVAQHYGLSWLLLGRVEEPQVVIEGIKAVELDQLQALVKQLVVPDEMRLVLVGKFRS